jgi:hypothetical protein
MMADEGDEPKVIGGFSDYSGFIGALRQRAADLNLAGEAIDDLSGLPSRYAQKLLGPRPIRRLGAASFGPVLGALAVRGVLVEDKTALDKVRRQTEPRQNQYVRDGAVHVELSRRFLQKIGAQGGRNSRKNMSRRLASQLGRRAANARWKPT